MRRIHHIPRPGVRIHHNPLGPPDPSSGCDYTFIDASPAASQGPENGCPGATVSGSTVAITAGFDTNPGNTIFVVIKGYRTRPP
jgi:hypothetical protein